MILPDYTGTVRYVLGPADMKGDVVSNTSVIAPTTGGGFEVQVTFTSTGCGRVRQDRGAALPVLLRQQEQSSAPGPGGHRAGRSGRVGTGHPSGQLQRRRRDQRLVVGSVHPVSGQCQLALELKYGSLPVRFVPQSVQTVSATIGKDSLRAGLLAGIGGIIVVMLYMLLYYRALGLIVLAGLAIGGGLLYVILTALSHSSGLTLTLAGVTGIIVAIGITVDSYVVYFERLKDEVRAGRTVRQSVERSFARAFRTVLTADLVSFMAALILYLFTIGDVRGFAFTLGLSTLLDVFTAWFFIRPATILIGRRRGFTENPVFGIGRGLGARKTREA